jgi:GLPGLI family protein
MTRTLIILLLILSLSGSVSAQKTTFTFDYQIDMEDSAEYSDTTRYKNRKNLRSTWLNSNDRSYVGMMCYDQDTTKNKLIITVFKTGKKYIIYTHQKKKPLEVKMPDNPYFNISEINVITKDFKREKPDQTISGYTCENILQTGAGHTFETWFTRDIPDAPAHAFYGIQYFARLPAYYQGVPVLYQSKSKDTLIQYKFISAGKHKRSLTVTDSRLVKFEDENPSE